MFNDTKAIIFDLDGTLVDSLWVWSYIDTNYLSKHNIIAPNNLHSEICHLSFIDTAKYFKNTFNIPDSIDEIMAEWNSMAYDSYSSEVFIKKGVKEFLDKLKDLGIKIALATSNSEELLTITLKNNNIYDYFDVITTTSEVTRGKDHPDVYLLTANKLNVDPKDCIVFEDILLAVRGAKKAGMKVFAVKDNHSINDIDNLINESDYFFECYTELI